MDAKGVGAIAVGTLVGSTMALGQVAVVEDAANAGMTAVHSPEPDGIPGGQVTDPAEQCVLPYRVRVPAQFAGGIADRLLEAKQFVAPEAFQRHAKDLDQFANVGSEAGVAAQTGIVDHGFWRFVQDEPRGDPREGL